MKYLLHVANNDGVRHSNELFTGNSKSTFNGRMSQNLEFPTSNHPSHLNSSRKNYGNSPPSLLKQKAQHSKKPLVYEQIHGFDPIKEEDGGANNSPGK